MDLLTPNPGVIVWTTIIFLILFFVLKKTAWKPLLNMLDAREIKIRSALEEAEKVHKDANLLLAEQKELLLKARNESNELIERGRKHADKIRVELIEQAQIDAEKLLETARIEIENSKKNAIAEMKQYAVEIAIDAARKVIKDYFSVEQHSALIQKAIDELDLENNQ